MTSMDFTSRCTFDEIKRICYSDLDANTLLEESVRRLRRAVSFDAHSAVTIDPSSGLLSGVASQEGLISASEFEFFFRNIYFDDDVNEIGWISRTRKRVALLSETTGGNLELALRHRDFNRHKDLEYELRGAFDSNHRLWGGICLIRETGSPDFSSREKSLIFDVSPHIGAGLRLASLRHEATTGDPHDVVGVLVLDSAARVMHVNESAITYLQNLSEGKYREDRLPVAVWQVTQALQRTLSPVNAADIRTSPRLCVKSSGGWLTLQASLTEGDEVGRQQTIVVISPSRPDEISWLREVAYGLTAREKEVVHLVVRGNSTKQISAALHISEATVQDHVCHVFEKTGVRSRRELLKKLFFDGLSPESSSNQPTELLQTTASAPLARRISGASSPASLSQNQPE